MNNETAGADTQSAPRKTPLPWWRSLTVQIVSLALGLGGIAATALTYYFPPRPRPVFMIDSVRATLVDAERDTGLTLLFKDRPFPPGSKITAVRVYFWNAGRSPIWANDVLLPVQLDVMDGAEILSTKVLKPSRQEIGLRVETDARRVVLGFKVLEPNDGTTIQVLLLGTPSARLSAAGSVVGVGSPIVITQGASENDGSLAKAFFMTLVGILAGVAGFTRATWVTPLPGRRQRALLYVTATVTTLCGIMLLVVLFLLQTTPPQRLL